MIVMNKTQVILDLYNIGAIEFGEFKLKSGQTSLIYLNLRKIISYPQLLKYIANLMADQISSCRFDLLCGVPYTALPIATCISITQNIPMIMRRKEKKDYGTKQLVEGCFQKNQTALIIEDVITTGSSILETAQDLEEAGLIINDVVALIDREQGGKNTLAQKYDVHTIFSMSEILNTLLNHKDVSTPDKQIILKYIQTGHTHD